MNGQKSRILRKLAEKNKLPIPFKEKYKRLKKAYKRGEFSIVVNRKTKEIRLGK